MKITRSNGQVAEFLSFDEYVSEVRSLIASYNEAHMRRVSLENEGGEEYEVWNEKETNASHRLDNLGWCPGAYMDDRNKMAYEVKCD